MSRIFEALQRSESERTGEAFPTPPAIATELLEAVERETPAVPNVAVAPPTMGSPAEFEPFQSLPAVIAPESRLISLTDKESLAAEKFRFLGVRLRQLQQAQGLRKVL